jgi:hypothetical protein
MDEMIGGIEGRGTDLGFNTFNNETLRYNCRTSTIFVLDITLF